MKFSSLVQPFRCNDCKKLTTGPYGVLGPELCQRCYDIAGEELTHQDENHGPRNPVKGCLFCEHSDPRSIGKMALGYGKRNR